MTYSNLYISGAGRRGVHAHSGHPAAIQGGPEDTRALPGSKKNPKTDLGTLGKPPKFVHASLLGLWNHLGSSIVPNLKFYNSLERLWDQHCLRGPNSRPVPL